MLVANIKLPNYQVRDLLIDLKSKGKVQSDGRISKQVFKEVRISTQKGTIDPFSYNHNAMNASYGK